MFVAGAGLALIFAMVFFPLPLFWVLWIGPMGAIVGRCLRKGVWKSFTAVRKQLSPVHS